MKHVPSPWAIEKLERLRRERAEGARPTLELPPLAPSPQTRPPDEDPERPTRRTIIVIDLLPDEGPDATR